MAAVAAQANKRRAPQPSEQNMLCTLSCLVIPTMVVSSGATYMMIADW